MGKAPLRKWSYYHKYYRRGLSIMRGDKNQYYGYGTFALTFVSNNKIFARRCAEKFFAPNTSYSNKNNRRHRRKFFQKMPTCRPFFGNFRQNLSISQFLRKIPITKVSFYCVFNTRFWSILRSSSHWLPLSMYELEIEILFHQMYHFGACSCTSYTHVAPGLGWDKKTKKFLRTP